MHNHRIELAGPGVTGVVVDAKLLRTVLSVLIEGSQQAVRIKTQGRSRARGTLPHWIDAATDFRVQISEGSTVLEVEAPTLLEVDPEAFSQRDLFPEVDPRLTSVDYLLEAAEAAVGGEEHADLYDRGLLKTLRQLDSVFDHGVESVGIVSGNGRPRRVRLTELDLSDFSELEAKIPPPRQVKAAGFLDSIRHSDRTFILAPPGAAKSLKGVAHEGHRDALQDMWGKRVLVSGLAHFTAGGKIQRIEAELIEPASDRDMQTWSVPEPVRRPLSLTALRVEQGPRSGLGAILGRWPGEESDESIAEALESLS